MSAKLDGVRKAMFLSFLFVLGANCAFSQALQRVVETVDNTTRITLTGNVPPVARAAFDHGAVDNAQPMKRILLLLNRGNDQEAALQAYMEQQQDKNSSNYHNWLTPQQFGAQFGPAGADIQVVTQWLQSQGFSIEKVYSGKTIIEFSGNAGQVQAAFGTAIRNYAVEGKMYIANANDPQIPSALSPVVTGVVSLNNFPRQSHVRIAGQAREVTGIPGLQPLFTFPNPSGNGTLYALAPGDFATIYNSKGLISSGNDGTGQTIAIVGETDIKVSDVQAFRQMFGLPANFASTNMILNGPDPGITSTVEETEADLDVEWSGAVAPGATVDFVVSASTSTTAGIDLSALYIVENNLAGVMSESYGTCEKGLGTAGNAFYNALWEQAAAQGITAILSAGDGGSAGCDDFNTAKAATQGLAVSGMASTPFNVALGGTDFDDVNNWSAYWSATNATAGTDVIGASALSYIPEIPWNQNCAQIGLTGCGSSAPQGSLNIVAGGGGASDTYAKPNWQLGVNGMPNDNHRDLPDVSLFASSGFDGSGYIICQTGAYLGQFCSLLIGESAIQIVGGTSASAPAFAGIMALVNQKQATGQNTAPRQGNANYVLYALAKKSGASCVSSATEAAGCIFNDIIKGNSVLPTGGVGVGTNSVPCQGASPNCSSTVASATGVLVQPISSTTEAWTATAGYDLATGLGSVNVNNLATNWGTVSTVPTTTILTLNPTTSITHGSNENVTVNITVTPKSGTATGDVSLLATVVGPNGPTQQGFQQYTLGAGGSVSGTTQDLPGGTYTVTAHYAGDGTNAPSDSTPPVPVTVSPELSKTFLNLATFDINGNPTSFAATSATYGSGLAIFRVDVGDAAATVSSSTGISSNCSKRISTCPTGTVALTSTASSLGTSGMPLNILGYAETNVLPAGNYSVSSTYPGDSSYGSSTGTANFTIAKAPVTVIAGGESSTLGQFDQIVAGIMTTSTGIAPTGTCQFYVDGNPMGGPVPINQSAGFIPGGNPPNFAYADANSSTSFNSIGNHTLSAQYFGDSNYAAGTSAVATIAVAQGFPYFGAYANPDTINLGQQTTLIATVTGTVSTVTPTGTVTFMNGKTPISGAITYASSTATLTATMPYIPTTAGIFQINASYSGDSNYVPETTASQSTLTVSGPSFTFALQPSAVTVTSGSSAAYTIAVAGTNGFNSNVTFTCALVAPAATCVVNPNSVAAGASSTVTVTTTKHQQIPALPDMRPFGTRARFPLYYAIVAFVALLLIYAGLTRKRRLFVGAAFAQLLLLIALDASGCGGGGGGGGGGSLGTFGTQAGTYNVAITGTSGSITNTTSVTLIVQ